MAIVRLEQLYPLLEEMLATALAVYPKNIPLIWVQEEPLNMGAYSFLKLRFGRFFSQHWLFGKVGRPTSATPATGSASSHKLEQSRLFNEVFDSGK